MECGNCNNEMLIEESLLDYWIKWLCPKCGHRQLERLNKLKEGQHGN